MIKQAEIRRLSEEYRVLKQQIDKDWVLSYLLRAIVIQPDLQDIIVFKGGTCLRKCYFPDYRFSEDLDFTIRDTSFVFDENIVKQIIDFTTEMSFDEGFNRGILFRLKEIQPTKSEDVEQGFKIYLHYWGADHRKNDMPSPKQSNWHHTIKLDINHTEEIIYPTVQKPINHNFSDNDKFESAVVNCYSLEEVLSEKMRSLIQRKYTSPRDCYDIWYLKNNCSDLNWKDIKAAFFRKLESKNIIFESATQLMNPRKENILKRHWNTQLANQFPTNQLPDYNIVISELKLFLNELFDK